MPIMSLKIIIIFNFFQNQISNCKKIKAAVKQPLRVIDVPAVKLIDIPS